MTTSTDTFRQKLNSRKLLICLLFEAIAATFLANGMIQADHWVTVTITVAGAYLASQAYVDRQ